MVPVGCEYPREINRIINEFPREYLENANKNIELTWNCQMWTIFRIQSGIITNGIEIFRTKGIESEEANIEPFTILVGGKITL